MSCGPRQVSPRLLWAVKMRLLTNAQTQPSLQAAEPRGAAGASSVTAACEQPTGNPGGSKEAGDPGSLWAGDVGPSGDPRGQVRRGPPAVTWHSRKSLSVALRGGQNNASPPQMRPSPEAQNP